MDRMLDERGAQVVGFQLDEEGTQLRERPEVLHREERTRAKEGQCWRSTTRALQRDTQRQHHPGRFLDHQPNPEDIVARYSGDLLRGLEEQPKVLLYRELTAWVHVARMVAREYMLSSAREGQ
jgi:hypothetical protein